MYGGTGNWIGGLILTAAIVGGIIFACIGYCGHKIFEHYFPPVSIESSAKIIPTIKLTIKENKVDTIYVYTVKE